jgi:hypothetical protein
MNSPENAGSKTKIDWQEIALAPIEGTQIAYHGLVARIHDIRAGVADSRIAQLEHLVDFTEDLVNVGHKIVDEKLPQSSGHNRGFVVHPNFPEVKQMRNPLEIQAEARAEILSKRGLIASVDKSQERLLDLRDISGRLSEPINGEESRMLKKSLKDMRTIRNKRRDQTRYGNMVGGAGIRSGILTHWDNFKSRRSDRKAYKSGAIDTIEAENRKDARKHHEHRLPPYQVLKSGLQITAAENRITTDLSRQVERAKPAIKRKTEKISRLDISSDTHRKAAIDIKAKRASRKATRTTT